jgi:hypothetical protein
MAAAAAAASSTYRELTDLHAIQALLAETVAQEALLDEKLEELLLQRSVRLGPTRPASNLV